MNNENTNKSEEEEEIVVYVDFNSKLDDECISAEKELKVIGIETERPILQLGNQVYRGEWRDAVGTHVIFEEGDNVLNNDNLFCDNPSTVMKYYCKTEKILHMSRIFLNPNNKTNVDVLSDNNTKPVI